MPDPFAATVTSHEAAVRAAGYRPSVSRRGVRQWRRDVQGAIQVVEVVGAPTAAWARRRRPDDAEVRTWLGVVHPVLDLAFARVTPDPIRVAEDAHVRRLLDTTMADGLAWLDLHVDPRAALADEAAVDPFVALEIAALVVDLPAGDIAAAAARTAAANESDPERRRQLEVRWREAVTRLHTS